MFQVAPIPINLDDLDALIADLSPEEVEELGSVDPDVSIFICRDQKLFKDFCHNNTGGRILLSKLKNGFFLKSSSSEVDFENLPYGF